MDVEDHVSVKKNREKQGVGFQCDELEMVRSKSRAIVEINGRDLAVLCFEEWFSFFGSLHLRPGSFPPSVIGIWRQREEKEEDGDQKGRSWNCCGFLHCCEGWSIECCRRSFRFITEASWKKGREATWLLKKTRDMVIERVEADWVQAVGVLWAL